MGRLTTVLLVAVTAGAAAAEGGLSAKLAPERSKVLAGSRVQLGAILTLEASDAPDGMPAASVAISLVIDRSGSMREAGKMTMVHVAGTDLVDRLESMDSLGLVTYSVGVDVVRPMATLAEPEGVKKLITQIRGRGGTNLGGGLRQGIDLFKAGGVNGSVRRLLLLTDGLANQGETRPDVLAKWAKDAFIGGARVSTVGLGADYNEELLKKIAHGGGGEFYYVTSKAQLPELFRKELEEGRTVVVKDLLATVRVAGKGAKFREIIGYPPTGGDELAREVKIGDLYAMEKRTLLVMFEIAPPEAAANTTWRAATVALAWKDHEGAEHAAELPLEFGVTYSENAVAESVDPEARNRIVETENYRQLDEAMELYRQGKSDEALKVIKGAMERIAGDDVAARDPGLIAQAGQLAQAKREMEQRHDARSTQLYNKSAGAFGYRSGGGRARKRAVFRGGGSRATESTVSISHNWLAKHQQKDGSWDPAAHGGRAGDRQLGTSLSLLAFLGAGHTENAGTWKGNVVGAVDWLIARQQKDGRIGEGGGLPADPLKRFRAASDHAVAALALSEAYGMGRFPRTGGAAQKAVDWLADAKPFELAAKLKGAEGITDDDVAGVAWCIAALKSGRMAGLRVKGESFAAALALIASREAEGQPRGRFAVFGKEVRSLDCMAGAIVRMFAGTNVLELRPGVGWAMSNDRGMPRWGAEGEAFDWYYTYFGNLAAFQCGGEIWRVWNSPVRDILVSKQRRGGAEDGSWDPVGTMKGRGRVLPTAIGTLCLEVYYRYLPMYH